MHALRGGTVVATFIPWRRIQTTGGRSVLWSKLKSILGAGTNSVDSSESGGRLVGTDALGNRYFEEEPDGSSVVPHRANRPRRFFLLPGQKSVDDSWMQMNADIPRLPSEWDSWLRHRRAHPPTLEEIARNEEAAQMRAQNGQEIEKRFIEELQRRGVDKGENCSSPKNKDEIPFPRHPGLEVTPGEQR